jgi:uncharacterized protein HemY
MTPSQAKRKAKAKPNRAKRERYDRDSNRRAIEYAIKKAGVPHWHPHQLRHSCGTRIRREHGLDVAQVLLGHRSASITEVYAEVDRAKAVAVMALELKAHFFLGNLAMIRSRSNKTPALLTEARDHFAAMLAIQPKNFAAGNNLAWLLANEFSQHEEALQLVTALCKDEQLDRLPTTFVDTVACVYRKAQRADLALQVLEPAVKRQPRDPQLQFQLGMALVSQQRDSDARQALETALHGGLSSERSIEARAALARLVPPASAKASP